MTDSKSTPSAGTRPRFYRDREVTALRPEARTYEVSHRDVAGLRVKVEPTGRRSFIFTYRERAPDGRRVGQRRKVLLGRVGDLKLADAKAWVDEYRRNMALGEDPHEARVRYRNEHAARTKQALARVTRNRWTVSRLASAYIDALEASGRRAHTIANVHALLNAHVLPAIGDVPVFDLTANRVEHVVGPQRQLHPSTAWRLRGLLFSMLDWARGKDQRRHALVKVGPTELRGMANVAAKVPPVTQPKRDADEKAHPHAGDVLTDEQLAVLYPDLLAQADEGSPHAAALALQLLTGTRAGETSLTRWEDLDLDGDDPTWTIPAANAKGRRDHLVFLSVPAVRLLARRQEHAGASPLVFPTARRPDQPVRGSKLATWLRRRLAEADLPDVGADQRIVPHSFRKTFATYVESRHGEAIRARVLNHARSDQLSRVYDKSNYDDQARALWYQWGAYLEALTEPAGTVVELQRRA